MLDMDNRCLGQKVGENERKKQIKVFWSQKKWPIFSSTTVMNKQIQQRPQSFTIGNIICQPYFFIWHLKIRNMSNKRRAKSSRNTQNETNMCTFNSFNNEYEMKKNLVTYDALPTFLRDNEYLEKYHRPQLNSVWECVHSIFRIHSETGNIWTHLFRKFFKLVLGIGLKIRIDFQRVLPAGPSRDVHKIST